MRQVKPVKPKFWLPKVVIGASMLGLFTYSLAEYRAFEAIAIHVQGKVLSIKHESKATGRRGNRVTIERPYVQFTVPGSGREITATAKVMSRQSFDVGSSLDLEMDPSRPEETVRVAAGLSVLDLSVGGVGLALMIFGVAEKLRFRREMRAGAAVAATAGNALSG